MVEVPPATGMPGVEFPIVKRICCGMEARSPLRARVQ